MVQNPHPQGLLLITFTLGSHLSNPWFPSSWSHSCARGPSSSPGEWSYNAQIFFNVYSTINWKCSLHREGFWEQASEHIQPLLASQLKLFHSPRTLPLLRGFSFCHVWLNKHKEYMVHQSSPVRFLLSSPLLYLKTPHSRAPPTILISFGELDCPHGESMHSWFYGLWCPAPLSWPIGW